MNYHEMNEKEVEQTLNTDFSAGLSDEEAEKRRKNFGYNELEEGEKQSLLLIFFSQFKDFMVLVLLAATLISGLLGEYIDAIAIIAIIILNSFLGFFQEIRAEKSLSALKELSQPHVQALRNGEWISLLSKELVPGDVIKFASGDRIGADVRIIESRSLEVEESALTGESVPVPKTVSAIKNNNLALGDMENMGFMGTMVSRGSGVGVVIGTGMKTAMGQIADLLQNADSVTTPLQRRLEQLGKILIVTALLLTVLVVVIGVLQGNDLYTMVLAGVSLAVAAIPEGLPAIVTIALSLGVQKMIRKNAIVRKLPAVETLGCASVICSDKTGTLTQNKMTVTKTWIGGKTYTVDGTGYEPQGQYYVGEQLINPAKDKALQQLLTFGMLCNHAEILQKDGDYVLNGDPTEGAILVAGMKAGFTRAQLLNQFAIVNEFPFDSTRKMMSVVVKDPTGRQFVVTKGAPDVLIGQSKSILFENRSQALGNNEKQVVQEAINGLASQALRTIAIGYKEISPNTLIMHEGEAEKDLIFIGLQGIIDPPRPEVKQAVKECKEAGIKTVMITGDHVITANAIAKQLGIANNRSKVMEGKELSDLSLKELEDIVEDVAVFARVSPEHKLKIVQAFQNRGHVVAMTGDGVNDAPAIKKADIGIAMGITGTDVAKEASSLVLMDDNFASIKSAIVEGRNIYENIRKFIRYLLASNVGEILVMLFAMLLALPLPLVPIQILWVNLVTDGLPAMALGLDRPEDNVMKRGPRSPNEGVFSRGLGWKVISRGFLIGISTILAFMFAYNNNPENLEYAQTVAFITLVLAQLIHVFDCRSEKSILSRNPFGNMYLVWAVISSLVLALAVIYVPGLQEIFHTLPIAMKDWPMIIGFASVPTFLLAGSFLLSKSK
ncbi:calcium-translocating P-type ATPase, SERCA-type [Niallia circulans]|jgi:P-type Ca2+ transporter type 2C|uniref:ATPase n=1 Tax=Niallia circulans TaxID=1397 RepID=A0A0J1IQM6_NIACI|nr:calcium-translocating P-type ATPase, SERCA-type [Niallia circulans]KLV28238.1 ATPase [Niallia circulans]MCM2979722.1 calcium-translocating P-type ATPase, SERCA-type [Niallia circulans]MDR4315664.1 calcium-translocating P-type ATPase, SERCA-type [Niallia circulans]MED3837090.1 calcium-translocating P-type ATPase, SERCA-type [Niallia circulans]MED4244160.1 calcium-translocating P-type ATPase, SERCA-type [Niallia circulans]